MKLVIIFAALFCFLLAIAVGVVREAQAAELVRVEAETQDNAATAPITGADATPTGATPNALRYDDPTTITYPVTVASGKTVNNIIVRGKVPSSNTQAITLNVVVDGVSQSGKAIGKTANTYLDRSWPVNLSSGSHTIGVKLTNAPGSNKIVTDYLVLDGSGSPPTDTDSDGVPDADDNCPNEPGPASNGGCPVAPASSSCPINQANTVDVNPGDDLDAKANAAGANTLIRVHGPAGTFYTVDAPIVMEANQTILGDAGTITQVGPANVPNPLVGARAANTSMSTMVRTTADGACIQWLDGDVQGAQKFINGLDGGPNQKLINVVVHEAQASGIGQYRGFVLDSEIYGNGTNEVQFDGTVAGIKMNYSGEVARSYVHDNPGNGIWCDVGCQSVPNQPNGWYVHDNVVGDNGRHGIFYENAPRPATNPGDNVKALIQDNVVYGSQGRSGISTADSAFGTIDSNILGKRLDGTIDHNLGNEGIEMHSSNDPTRGTQHDALITNNQMNGETIDGTGSGNTGCGDNGNVCSGNL